MADQSHIVALAHEVTGSGPLVVLLHGITESRRTWDPLVADLSHSHTVLAVDARGHGESPTGPAYDLAAMAGDVRELVGQIAGGAAAPLVVGHSMGGMVATAYAAAHPCRGVIVVDQSLDLAALQTQVKAMEPALRGDGFDSAIVALFDALRGPLSADEVARVEGHRRPDQDVVLGIWEPLLSLSPDELDTLVREVSGQIHVRFLSLHGVDPGPDYAGWLRQRIATAQVEVWPDHGHYPHLLAPDRFLDRLREFDHPR